MKRLNIFIIAAATLIISAAQCKKGEEQFGSNDIYFRCKINGQTYIPTSRGITCTIYQDTIFLLGGNNGFKVLGIGINDNDHIRCTIYDLNDKIGRRGDYKNSTIVDDRYFTDELHTGKLIIQSIDKEKRTIQGTFHFKAYNAYRNDSVTVTD